MKHYLFLFALVLPSVLLTGCGSGYKVVQVSGQLTLEGKPLANCRVLCLPQTQTLNAGPAAAGLTDADGRFTLTTTDKFTRKGAVAGTYVVRISWIDPDGTTNRDPAKPPKKSPYQFPANANNGTLTLVIPESGTKEANIAL